MRLWWSISQNLRPSYKKSSRDLSWYLSNLNRSKSLHCPPWMRWWRQWTRLRNRKSAKSLSLLFKSFFIGIKTCDKQMDFVQISWKVTCWLQKYAVHSCTPPLTRAKMIRNIDKEFHQTATGSASFKSWRPSETFSFSLALPNSVTALSVYVDLAPTNCRASFSSKGWCMTKNCVSDRNPKCGIKSVS